MASWNFPALNGIIRTSKNFLGGRLKFDFSGLSAERTLTLPDKSGTLVQAELTDNSSSALNFTEGANSYLKFVTSNGSEVVQVSKTLDLDAQVDVSTQATGLSIKDNEAVSFEIKEGANSYLKFDTTNAAEKIIVGKQLDLAEQSSAVITIQDNQGQALAIKEGSSNYIILSTSNGVEKIQLVQTVEARTINEIVGNTGVTIDGLLLKDGDVQSDRSVVATIAVADAPGGVTTAALTLDLYKQDGTTRISSARQVMIFAGTAAYQPNPPPSNTTSYGTPTKGSIIASGAAWCLAQTDAAGEFDCTATNSADETIYFTAQVPPNGLSDTTKGLTSCNSNSDAATWSA